MIGSNYSFFLGAIVLLLFSISNFVSTFASLTPGLCHPNQRDVLLQLKTDLVSLDLSFYVSIYSPPSSLLLSIENPPLFLRLLARNLRNLRALDMSYVNISSEIPHEFSYMLSLRSLHLERCSLVGEFPSGVFMIPNLHSIILDYNPDLRGSLPVFHRNNSLQVLRLRKTSFSGIIPDSIGNLKHLASLTLADSNFAGRIPSSLGELSNLSSLSLYRNHFTGEVPSSIGNLKQLISFGVSSNQLTGSFPSALLNLTKLRFIHLDSNQFTGSLPPNIGQLSKLEGLYAFGNSFTGAVPSSLLQISSLTELYLDDYQLSDLVGFENVSLFSNLEYLYFESNNFRVSSPVDLNVFSSLKQLVLLALSGIPLSTANITSDSDFSSNFQYLYLSDCNITEFPEFIRDQRNLRFLYLSNNNIKGQVPDWLWRLQELQILDLSHNSQSGFDGSLKAVPGSHIEKLNLNYLDLSNNNIKGQVPDWLWRLQALQILDLSHNSLSGFDGSLKAVPGSHIQILDLRQPHYIGDSSLNYRYYSSVVLMNKGVSMVMERILTVYTAIDFSGNRIHGPIPQSIGLLKELHVLNLSRNAFTGDIPSSLANITALESLDLSQNMLSGEIPPELGDLSSLGWINVSHNQLVGSIPQGTQFQRQACSSYEGNPRLFGPSLKDICRETTSPGSEPPVSSEEEEEEEGSFSWVAAGLGFAPGLVFGFTIGYIMKNLGRNKH
ncbi:hypothetical protein IGI04_033928 [Brassica rapa subsp. trilocularis]|uniref:Disease resistance R13L4/SHOC-2-like LRR domain-containing protein n=1 Tax=Brassica rapa subsp. trilocularis TaxID=1813537 RepID=A0ABQ7L786_BRACM|nr:hypothetical protein IGI04_033928 [Brassica rapa subsp. trilocularis]